MADDEIMGQKQDAKRKPDHQVRMKRKCAKNIHGETVQGKKKIRTCQVMVPPDEFSSFRGKGIRRKLDDPDARVKGHLMDKGIDCIASRVS